MVLAISHTQFEKVQARLHSCSRHITRYKCANVDSFACKSPFCRFVQMKWFHVLNAVSACADAFCSSISLVKLGLVAFSKRMCCFRRLYKANWRSDIVKGGAQAAHWGSFFRFVQLIFFRRSKDRVGEQPRKSCKKSIKSINT
jgi:hypothetical protein